MSNVRAARPTAAVLVAGSLGLVACSQGLFDNDNSTYRVPTEKLTRIVTTDVVAESKKQPITPEEATKAALAKGDPTPVWPSQVELGIADVRASTLKNNLDLRTQLVDPAIARREVDVERAKFEATLVANLSHDASNLAGDPAFGGVTSATVASLGVDLPLQTGGNIGVAGDLARNDTDTNLNFDGAGEWSSGVSFSISQPLLRNAGVNVNTASIRIAEQSGQVVSAQTKLETIRILAEADKAYWDLYAAYRELEVRKQQYELAVAQLERARRRVDQGDAAEIEVVRAESGVGGTLQGIILSAGAVRERGRALKRLMNRDDLPVESETLIVPKDDPNPLGLALDSRQLADRAVENRMEMLELELQLATSAIQIAVARNQALPNFVLDYRYHPVGSGSSFVRSMGNIGDLESDTWTLGLRGEIPIGNEAAKNRLAAAVLERVQRLASKDAQQQSIRVEVYDSVERLNTAWQSILAARLETVLAARTYEGEKRQFDVGVRTSQDVLDASTRLADARSREVTALAQWQIALVDIAFATGTLAGMAGAEWKPIDVDQLEKDSLGTMEQQALEQS